MPWLQRLLRLPNRPLQIPEVLKAAEEHLRAVAAEGLKVRYLPVRLSVAVSSDDFRGLEPFLGDLRREMQDVMARLTAKPRYAALSPRLEIDLIEAGDLTLGSAPRLHATFPEREQRATWRPGAPESSPSEPARRNEAAGTLFELVLTTVSGEQTGLQNLFVLCLEPALPAACLDSAAAPSRLVPGAGGEILHEESGEPWGGLSPRISPLETVLPAELDASVDIPPEARSSQLYRFYQPGRPEMLWAPQGLLLIGRRAELVHWVPAPTPRNLSGRHFALLRAPGNALKVMDLKSTNGTYLGGRRLTPFERLVVTPPETVEIGTEGTMRLDLRTRPSV